MPTIYPCVDCGVGCKPFKERATEPRCWSCWIRFIKSHPEASSNWRGGRHLNKLGYWLVRANGHPNGLKNGYILEHRLVMAMSLGRPLANDELVHHRNHDKTDNRLENLEIVTRKIHQSLHKRTSVCRICGKKERCKGLCENHYAASVNKILCAGCGKVRVWKDSRSPDHFCKSCALKGSANGRAKLTENDVKDIRGRRKRWGTPYQTLANEYGVSKHLVMLVCHRKIWRHV